METAVQDCHHRFVRGLITTYQDLPYNKKRACAGCLVRLYTKMPGDLRQEIVDLLLNSAYIVIRRRGYEALGKDWRPTFQPMIEAAWLHHQDLECAHLVIEHFPVEYLLANLSDLEERVKRSRHLTRLYLRVGEGNPARLERLRASDGITFAYVSAKLGMKLDPEDALDLYEQYRNDQRRGLLLWCFGQMKLWSALVQIKELLDKEAEDRWGISMQIEPSTIEPE